MLLLHFYRHRNPIVAICFVPTLRLQSLAIDYSCGRYYMLGREGLISMWTLNMKLSGYRWIGSDGRSSLPKYYIDMTVLYPSTLIAVISTERCIAIWEMHSDGRRTEHFKMLQLSSLHTNHTWLNCACVEFGVFFKTICSSLPLHPLPPILKY